MGELYAEGASASCLGAKVCCVSEELKRRYLCLDFAHVASVVFHAHDFRAAGVKLSHDVAHEVFRRADAYIEDRLQKYRVPLLYSFLYCDGSCRLEGCLRGIHSMVGAVREFYVYINNRIACYDALGESFHCSLFHRGDKGLRNCSADDGIGEGIA